LVLPLLVLHGDEADAWRGFPDRRRRREEEDGGNLERLDKCSRTACGGEAVAGYLECGEVAVAEASQKEP
jgi:hypothetical protein